ncbi:transposase [Bradyrhizobium sp. 159]|uniref:IS66 family transposase n=1 Tax=Bradyrhizobium sp. 159 TaxID=2782632 RepID=UPI001FF73BCB|nr:transposase [Bradyrhizobium sp. 159]
MEGVPIAPSTMAHAGGSVSASLDALLRLVKAHVMAPERLHADDSVLQKHTERMIEMV